MAVCSQTCVELRGHISPRAFVITEKAGSHGRAAIITVQIPAPPLQGNEEALPTVMLVENTSKNDKTVLMTPSIAKDLQPTNKLNAMEEVMMLHPDTQQRVSALVISEITGVTKSSLKFLFRGLDTPELYGSCTVLVPFIVLLLKPTTILVAGQPRLCLVLTGPSRQVLFLDPVACFDLRSATAIEMGPVLLPHELSEQITLIKSSVLSFDHHIDLPAPPPTPVPTPFLSPARVRASAPATAHTPSPIPAPIPIFVQKVPMTASPYRFHPLSTPTPVPFYTPTPVPGPAASVAWGAMDGLLTLFAAGRQQQVFLDGPINVVTLFRCDRKSTTEGDLHLLVCCATRGAFVYRSVDVHLLGYPITLPESGLHGAVTCALVHYLDVEEEKDVPYITIGTESGRVIIYSLLGLPLPHLKPTTLSTKLGDQVVKVCTQIHFTQSISAVRVAAIRSNIPSLVIATTHTTHVLTEPISFFLGEAKAVHRCNRARVSQT
eukprot:m.101525 g.101525  ORF g.101525 m.101525 type:complete len:491 (-) comp14090_c6_seq3:21-1493(-)